MAERRCAYCGQREGHGHSVRCGVTRHGLDPGYEEDPADVAAERDRYRAEMLVLAEFAQQVRAQILRAAVEGWPQGQSWKDWCDMKWADAEAALEALPVVAGAVEPPPDKEVGDGDAS